MKFDAAAIRLRLDLAGISVPVERAERMQGWANVLANGMRELRAARLGQAEPASVMPAAWERDHGDD